MQDHDEDGEQEGLILGRNISWVADGGCGENHGCNAVVDCSASVDAQTDRCNRPTRWCCRNLGEPVAPARDPRSERTPAFGCKDR